jgi:hypothetical protein
MCTHRASLAAHWQAGSVYFFYYFIIFLFFQKKIFEKNYQVEWHASSAIAIDYDRFAVLAVLVEHHARRPAALCLCLAGGTRVCLYALRQPARQLGRFAV